MAKQETDGARARRIWERIEREGLFFVYQIVADPDYELLVRVPWCRYARGIKTDADYESLVAKLQEYRAIKAASNSGSPKVVAVQVTDSEDQFLLF